MTFGNQNISHSRLTTGAPLPQIHERDRNLDKQNGASAEGSSGAGSYTTVRARGLNRVSRGQQTVISYAKMARWADAEFCHFLACRICASAKVRPNRRYPEVFDTSTELTLDTNNTDRRNALASNRANAASSSVASANSTRRPHGLRSASASAASKPKDRYLHSEDSVPGTVVPLPGQAISLFPGRSAVLPPISCLRLRPHRRRRLRRRVSPLSRQLLSCHLCRPSSPAHLYNNRCSRVTI